MQIKVLSIEPRLDQNGQPDSFVAANQKYFPQIVKVTDGAREYVGEANPKNLPPRYQPGEDWEIEMVPDNRCTGGYKFKGWSRPQTGGSNAYYPPTQNQAQQYPQPNATTTPRPNYQPSTQTHTPTFQQPTTTAAPGTGAAPYAAQPTQTRNKENYTQAMIITQTAVKAAAIYIAALNDKERNDLIMSLNGGPIWADGESINAEEDPISAYADKIARETIVIAQRIYPSI